MSESPTQRQPTNYINKRESNDITPEHFSQLENDIIENNNVEDGEEGGYSPELGKKPGAHNEWAFVPHTEQNKSIHEDSPVKKIKEEPAKDLRFSNDGGDDKQNRSLIEDYKKNEINHTATKAENTHDKLGQHLSKSKAPIQITWKNLVVKTRATKKRWRKPAVPSKVILNGLEGTVKPGQFVAILGASGAGKTTFLNYLSGKTLTKTLKYEGEITLNGVSRESFSYTKYIAYIMQDDILLETMTVRECLTFAAKLRVKGTNSDRIRRVNDIIEELALVNCADTRIGGNMIRGVSGGERKRTSIGVELITDPNLIFLDEPTTGLDSFTANTVVEILKSLSMSGRTVICTIHQPNSDIYDIFDQLLLLAQGRIIYLNSAKKAVDYFGSIGYQCPRLTNPADYFMKIMSAETLAMGLDEDDQDNHASKAPLVQEPQDVAQKYKERIDNFHDSYKKSQLKCDPDDAVPNLQKLKDVKEDGRSVSWFYQFWLLLIRSMQMQIRTPTTSYAKAVIMIINGLLCLVLFWNIGYGPESYQNRRGGLFFITMTVCMTSIQNIILLFPDERAVFLREQSNGMYKVSSYYMAKLVSELPAGIFFPVLFGCVVYHGMNLNTSEAYKFWAFLGLLIAMANTAASFGLLLGAIVPNKQVAVALIPILIIPFMLFAGFFVNQANLPKWLYEFVYLSIFKYGFQVLVYNEFTDNYKLENAQEQLDSFNFTESYSETIIIMLCGLFIGFRLLAFLVLKRLANKVS